MLSEQPTTIDFILAHMSELDSYLADEYKKKG